MGFYENKQKALEEVDKMLSEGVPLVKIYFKIETKYGFGEKLVNKRVERLKELMNFKETPAEIAAEEQDKAIKTNTAHFKK